jgi:hypothetical protein
LTKLRKQAVDPQGATRQQFGERGALRKGSTHLIDVLLASATSDKSTAERAPARTQARDHLIVIDINI